MNAETMKALTTPSTTHNISPLDMVDAMDVVFEVAKHFGMQYDEGFAKSSDASFSVELRDIVADPHTAEDYHLGRTYRVSITNRTLSHQQIVEAIPAKFRHLLKAV